MTPDPRLGPRRDLLPDLPRPVRPERDGAQAPAPGRVGCAPTYHGYQGGDLIGVVEHLDYLVDLGINAVYFTPIFQSASNHRYHTHDYEKVDPMLGGNPALRRMIDEAHARGIRVVLDGVFNHASRGFFQFHDIMENGPNSAYLDWFTVKEFPLYAYDAEKAPNYKAWWGLPALPKFNTDCPEVREFLWGIGRKWMEFGIDGWRLDVPNEIDDDDFWREFRRRVRAVNPEAYIVGEVWVDAPRWLQGDMWDAVMNYQFTRACIAFFIGESVNLEDLTKTSLHPGAAARGRGVPQGDRAADRPVSPERDGRACSTCWAATTWRGSSPWPTAISRRCGWRPASR